MDVWSETKGPSKGYQERSELRLAIAGMSENDVLRLTPSRDEPMRKLKVMVRWAATEADKKVDYMESEKGDLLVRLAQEKPESTSQRGRPRKTEMAAAS